MLMRKKKMYSCSKCISFVIIFSIGICVGKLFDFGYFVLSKDISIIDAISLFVTVGCAIYITKVLEKEVQDDRIEKDLYLIQVNKIEQFLNEIENSIDEENIPYSKIVSSYSNANKMKTKFFQRISNKTTSHLNNTALNNIKDEFDKKFRWLKRILTYTPSIDDDIDNEINISSGIISYSSERILTIKKELDYIYDKIFEIKIIINRG